MFGVFLGGPVVWERGAAQTLLKTAAPLALVCNGRARLSAKLFAETGDIPDSYWRDARWWITIGLIATVPLLIILYLMVFKP